MRRKGFEPPTYWFVASYSIQLSYRRILRLQTVNSDIIAYPEGKVKSFFKKIFLRIDCVFRYATDNRRQSGITMRKSDYTIKILYGIMEMMRGGAD